MGQVKAFEMEAVRAEIEAAKAADSQSSADA